MKRHRAGSLVNAIEAQLEQETFVAPTPPEHPIVVSVPGVSVPTVTREMATFDPCIDPRPDLASDSALWTVLLMAAAEVDGDVSDGVTGILHGLRCLGARLMPVTTGGARLEHGEIPPAEWLTYRARYLVPRAAMVTRLLKGLRM